MDPTHPPSAEPNLPDAAEHDLFVVCLPGLEPWLDGELRGRIGLTTTESLPGGVACRGDLDAVYRVNLLSGIANHVLIRVAAFGARSLADLDHRGARIDWRGWLAPGQPFTVRARCRRSRIYHSGAVEERITKHLAEQLGTPSGGDEPDPVTIRVRIEDNRCTVSLDSSGAPLHRRGWRLDPGRAPLREDLAHALLLASGWDRTSPLVDPMMGSGTILIEAAALARGMAPGRLRRFAVENFAIHDPERWAAVQAAATAAEVGELPFPIHGGDRDPAAVTATTGNAERAGVAGDLELHSRTLSEAAGAWLAALVSEFDRGALVTNPPYGKRLAATGPIANLYRALGSLVAPFPPGWQVAMAVADRRLALRTGLDLRTAFLVDSGGSKIRGMRFPPPADPTE